MYPVHRLTHTFARKVEQHLGCIEYALDDYVDIQEADLKEDVEITHSDTALIREMAILGEMIGHTPQREENLNTVSGLVNSIGAVFLTQQLAGAVLTDKSVILSFEPQHVFFNAVIVGSVMAEVGFLMPLKKEFKAKINYVSDRVVSQLPEGAFPHGQKPRLRKGYDESRPPTI